MTERRTWELSGTTEVRLQESSHHLRVRGTRGKSWNHWDLEAWKRDPTQMKWKIWEGNAAQLPLGGCLRAQRRCPVGLGFKPLRKECCPVISLESRVGDMKERWSGMQWSLFSNCWENCKLDSTAASRLYGWPQWVEARLGWCLQD